MKEDTKTQDALSHRERVAQQRRVREARPTMLQTTESWGGSPSSGADAPPSPDGRRTLPLFILSIVVLAFAPTVVFAQQEQTTQPEAAQTKTEAAPATQTEEPAAKKEDDGKLKAVPGGKALGMSILGNQEAPKALVIVPWKRSELGNALGISTMLDDSKLPIDKEVFMRMLSYYEIRSEAPAKSTAAQPTAATQRRK